MKFGNYNITTTPKERSRKLDIFRFSKIKSTTNSFVDRFQSKIETFRRLKSRSESPLSFRASLFERDGVDIFPRPVCEKFSPKDFPKSHFRGDNFYVFGNTIRKLGVNQKSISGKNNYLSENFYYTLTRTIPEEEQQPKSTTTVGSTTIQPPPRKNSKSSSRRNSSSIANANNNTTSNKVFGSSNINRITKNCTTLERKHTKSSQRQCDAIDLSSSGVGSYVEKEIDLNNVNNTLSRRRYTSSLKDMLDSVSYLDEDTEFKVLKDYFETNSYSDIVKDSAFKDYLNKKNYNDILDYLNEEGGSGNEGTMSLKRQTSMADEEFPSSFYDNATDNSKLYKWKSTGNLYESLSSFNNHHNSNNNKFNYSTNSNNHINTAASFNNGFDGYRTVDRLETSTYRRQRKQPTYIGSTTSLNRRTNSKIQQRQRERDRQQELYQSSINDSIKFDKFPFILSTNKDLNSNQSLKRSTSRCEFAPMLKTPTNNYDDVKRFCDLFLNEHYTFNNKWGKIDTSTLAKRYTERQYKKLINKFIKSKGYVSTDEYVQAKFGAILDRSIPKPSTNTKSEKLDLPKTYIDNVQRRYHVTKQHFLAAQQIHNQSLQSSYQNSQSLNDLYR